MNNPLKNLAYQDISFIDRNLYSALFFTRHIFKNNQLLKIFDYKLRSRIANKLRKKKTSGTTFEIPRVSKNISVQEFKEKYAKPGIPCIIEAGCADWVCTEKWSFDFLEKFYAETDFNLSYQKGFTPQDEVPGENYHDKVHERVKIKDLIQSIKSDGKKYMRFCPIMEDNPELIKDLDLKWLRDYRICMFGCSYQTFIGAKNRWTPIHCGMTAFFFILPVGQKRWTLFSTAYKPLLSPEVTKFGHNFTEANIKNPDLQKYPGMDLVDRYHSVQKEGDILYVPAWMWHEVENDEDTWGISYRFPHMAQAFSESTAFTLKRLFLTDPPFWKVMYYSFFNTNVSKRDKYLLTPKVYRT